MSRATKRQRENRVAIKSKGTQTMKLRKRARLLDEAGCPLVITLTYPKGYFGFPVRQVDPVTRDLVDAALAGRAAQ